MSFLSVFQSKWKNAVVRTVDKVSFKNGEPIVHHIDHNTRKYHSFRPDEQHIPSGDCFRVQRRGGYVSGSTISWSENPDYEHSKFYGKVIHFNGGRYCEPDFSSTGSGWFDLDRDDRICPDPPRAGDTIMGLCSAGNNAQLYFTHWFLPSPQFLRIWKKLIIADDTALDNDDYEAQLDTSKFHDWAEEVELRYMSLPERIFFMQYGPWKHEKPSYKFCFFWVDFYQTLVQNSYAEKHEEMKDFFDNLMYKFGPAQE